MIKNGMFANIVEANKIHIPVMGEIGKATVAEGERKIEILSSERCKIKSNLDGEAVDMLVLTLGEELRVDGLYTVEVEGIGCGNAVPMGIFDTEYFNERYLYEGDDLGAVIHGEETTFKLWAPTAMKVTLKLFSEGEGGEATLTVDMTRGEKGVFEHGFHHRVAAVGDADFSAKGDLGTAVAPLNSHGGQRAQGIGGGNSGGKSVTHSCGGIN